MSYCHSYQALYLVMVSRTKVIIESSAGHSKHLPETIAWCCHLANLMAWSQIPSILEVSRTKLQASLQTQTTSNNTSPAVTAVGDVNVTEKTTKMALSVCGEYKCKLDDPSIIWNTSEIIWRMALTTAGVSYNDDAQSHKSELGNPWRKLLKACRQSDNIGLFGAMMTYLCFF